MLSYSSYQIFYLFIYFFVLLSFFTYESTVVIHIAVMLPVSFVMKFAKLYLNNDDKN